MQIERVARGGGCISVSSCERDEKNRAGQGRHFFTDKILKEERREEGRREKQKGKKGYLCRWLRLCLIRKISDQTLVFHAVLCQILHTSVPIRR